MSLADEPGRRDPSGVAHRQGESSADLRLYIAGSTPNSVRAEHNLSVALERLQGVISTPALEIIDVFSHARRAIVDGVVVTPTLIGLNDGKRFVLMGDLSDQRKLEQTLQDLVSERPHT